MQLISKYKKRISGCSVWKTKKVLQLDNFGRQQNKTAHEASEFYSTSTKVWLQENKMEIYSVHNEGKPAASERFIRTFGKKII